MRRIVTVLFLLMLCSPITGASELEFREIEFLGLRLGMGEAEAIDQIVGQGFSLVTSSQEWYRYQKTAENGQNRVEVRFYLTTDKRIWKLVHSVKPQSGSRSRSSGPDPYYLELLERYGTPDEGGPERARSTWRESDEWGVPTLTIESRGGTASVLEWPALKTKAAGSS